MSVERNLIETTDLAMDQNLISAKKAYTKRASQKEQWLLRSSF